MTAQPHTDDLTQLRMLVQTQQARLAQLERHRRFPRRFVPLALVGLLVALLPLSILAAGPVFSDLGTAAEVHRPNIQAIGDAGLTFGFEDPNNPGQRLYNPKDIVTREEMATFLARTAGLGANPPVVNAKTAITATTAGNAAQLGGVAAANYVQTNSSPTLANLTVSGTISKAYTSGTTSRAIPIAYGTVSQSGALLSGTPNVSSSFNAADAHYEIVIAGEPYYLNTYQTLVTPVGSLPLIPATNSVNNTLLVQLFSPSGDSSRNEFAFVVYRP